MEVVFNPFSLARRLKRPLILDGAMGSLLHLRGAHPDPHLWMSYVNITNSELVKDLHKEYITAGADIITTNTFRTNPYVMNQSKIKDSDIIEKSVSVALDAVENLPVFIAGSNAPAEDCYQRERTISREVLQENHFAHITALYKDGCHFILNETQSHWDEIEIICRICKDEDIPFVISLHFDDNFKLLSGEKVTDAVEMILNYSPLAIGFNCIKPDTFVKFINEIKPEYNWGFYLNCGEGNFNDGFISCLVTPTEYRELVKEILPKHPSFIGGCCGTDPEYIRSLKILMNEPPQH